VTEARVGSRLSGVSSAVVVTGVVIASTSNARHPGGTVHLDAHSVIAAGGEPRLPRRLRRPAVASGEEDCGVVDGTSPVLAAVPANRRR